MAEGHAVSRDWPYGYAALGDGTRVDDTLRDLYDEYSEGRNGGVPSPFTLEGVQAFDRWLSEQEPGAPAGVNRVLAQVYTSRTDLRAAYPDLGSDRAAVLRWAQEHGRHEVPALARVMSNGSGDEVPQPASSDQSVGIAAGTPPAAPLRDAPWGVNVVGDFCSEGEQGETAGRLVALLDRNEIPALPVASHVAAVSDLRPYATAGPEDAPFPVNLICIDPEGLPEFARQAGQDFFAGRCSVGLWFAHCRGALERRRRNASLVEEIWAPSAYAAAVLAPVQAASLTTIRVPVAPVRPQSGSRTELGLGLALDDERFLFLSSFDYLSMFERKNPLAVIEAFGRAFAPGDGATLIIRCVHVDHDRAAHGQLLEAVSGHQHIEVIDRRLSPPDAASLTALSDCYISLHRAEAFGLAMAEAMWFGRPVIATGYSGNLDYMTSANSYLVDHQLVPVGAGHEPYAADGLWAQPDIDHAAKLMRHAFEDRDAAGAVGQTAAQDIRRTHGPVVAGEILERRLESIRGTGRARRAADPVREHPPAGAKLALRVRQGPLPGPRGRAGRTRKLARRALLRAIKPYTAYQQSINQEMVAAIAELSGRLAEQRVQAALERAYRMAELRELERRQSSQP